MAINAIIYELEACGIPATVEYEGGMWGHTHEYNRFRIAGKRGLMKYLKGEFEGGNVKAGIQLALLKNTHNEATEECSDG